MMSISQELSVKFLVDASLLYRETCPELSRFLMQRPSQNKMFSSLLHSTSVCQYCCQWLKPDDVRVRLRPKRRPSPVVQSILLRKARGKRLSVMQKKLLFRFQKSSSVLMATCHACSQTSRHQGANRDFLSTLSKNYSTPGSAGKHKTPQSSGRSSKSMSKTPSKDKTPAQTPRSSISSTVSGSSSTSSKSSSKSKNWVFQRLSKILMRDENQDTKKGGLKDFLSSL
uniref:Si:dkey-184p18.2 n=1 Tax=Oryzias latipes TaxID=8090 RepID=A0A3P9HTK1_ORYLA